MTVKFGVGEGGDDDFQFLFSQPVFSKYYSRVQIRSVQLTCVRSCLTHVSETWPVPVKVERELKLNRIEMSTNRWMCGVKLNERKKSEEL